MQGQFLFIYLPCIGPAVGSMECRATTSSLLIPPYLWFLVPRALPTPNSRSVRRPPPYPRSDRYWPSIFAVPGTTFLIDSLPGRDPSRRRLTRNPPACENSVTPISKKFFPHPQQLTGLGAPGPFHPPATLNSGRIHVHPHRNNQFSCWPASVANYGGTELPEGVTALAAPTSGMVSTGDLAIDRIPSVVTG
jgi:hypothetical protein